MFYSNPIGSDKCKENETYLVTHLNFLRLGHHQERFEGNIFLLAEVTGADGTIKRSLLKMQASYAPTVFSVVEIGTRKEALLDVLQEIKFTNL